MSALVPGLSSRLVVFFSHIPERGLGRWGASSGGAMAPENHIPEILLPTQAVPAAREGRNKRCAGAQGMATRGHWVPVRELVFEPGWAGTEKRSRKFVPQKHSSDSLSSRQIGGSRYMFPRQVTLIDWRYSLPLSSSRAQCRVSIRQ